MKAANGGLENLNLLKEVLAIPTKSRMEARMVAWLVRYCDQRGLLCDVDPIGNVYVTKGRAGNGHFPCVIAHSDSVHEPQPITVVQSGDKLTALNAAGMQAGLGGDDKAGICILTLL